MTNYKNGLNTINNIEFNLYPDPNNKNYYLTLIYQTEQNSPYRYYVSTKHLAKIDKYFDFDRPQKDNDPEEISHYKHVKDHAQPILKLHHNTINKLVNIFNNLNNKSIF